MNRPYVLMVVLYACAIGYYSLSAIGVSLPADNIYLYWASSLIAIVLGFRVLGVMGASGVRARTIMLVTTGIALWFTGDIIWHTQLKMLGEIPFPSYGDYFYLVGYAVLLAASLNELFHIRSSFVSLSNRRKSLMATVLVVFSLAFVYIAGTIMYDPEALLWQNIILLGYTAGDIALVLCSVGLLGLIWTYEGGKIARVWVYLLAAFVITFIADIYYAIRLDDYESGVSPVAQVIDLLYIGGYVYFSMAFLSMHEILAHLHRFAHVHQKLSHAKKTDVALG